MPSITKQGSLTTGTTIRIVNTNGAVPPAYVIEVVVGADAMGVAQWHKVDSVSSADFIATLQALGVIP